MTLLRHYLAIPLLFFLSALVYGNQGFEKNEGQFRHPDGTINNDVLYGFNENGLKITLRKNGFSYEYTSIQDSAWKKKVHSMSEDFSFTANQERIDFIFPQLPKEIVLAEELKYRSIYHLNDKQITAKNYRKIIYRNVGNGYDVVFKIGSEGFKYDIIKDKGISLEDFYLTIGTDASVKKENNNIKFSLSAAFINEELPYS